MHQAGPGSKCEIRAVLFDWGGTLASVHREDEVWQRCAHAAAKVLSRGGCSLSGAAATELRRRFVEARAGTMAHPSGRELMLDPLLRMWLGEKGVAEVDDALCDRAVDAFWRKWTECLDLLDDSVSVLARLAARGLLLGLVSNVIAPGGYCRTQLDRLGLLEHLDTLTFSSEVGMRKPRPEVYRDALSELRRLNRGPPLQAHEVLFVGDSPEGDVDGPARFGMQTALLTHPALEAPWPASDYDHISPTYRITRLRELEELLSL